MRAKPLKDPPQAKASHGDRYPVRSAEELRLIGDAYRLNELSIAEICERYGLRGPGEFNRLRIDNKWKGRSQGSKPASYMRRRHAKKGRAVYRGAAEYAADQRAEVEKREREQYPGLVDDANLLRKRGFVIDRVYEPVFRVGNALCTGAELHAKAERERRLMAPPPEPPATVAPRHRVNNPATEEASKKRRQRRL